MGLHPRVARSAPALAFSLVAALATAGCDDASDAASHAVAVAAAPAPAPVDQVLPGELAEGTEDAFGLLVPRLMNVKARFAHSLFATGQLPPEQVANYVRARVVAEHIDTGPAKTVFSGARAKPRGGAGAAGQRVMRIEVSLKAGLTELVVRDQTPPPVRPNQTPAESLREYGLDPDGKLLDTTQME